MKYILSYGTLSDGFSFIGVFDTIFEASSFLLKWAKDDEDWNVHEIETTVEAENRLSEEEED